jgi:hypothetical protein
LSVVILILSFVHVCVSVCVSVYVCMYVFVCILQDPRVVPKPRNLQLQTIHTRARTHTHTHTTQAQTHTKHTHTHTHTGINQSHRQDPRVSYPANERSSAVRPVHGRQGHQDYAAQHRV